MNYESKDSIRKAVLQKRDSLSGDLIISKSSIITEKVVKLEEYLKAENILIYAAMRSEVRTDEIILKSLKYNKNVFCPKCIDTKNGLMEFVKIKSIEDLTCGYYGIREPRIGEASVLFDGVSFDVAKTLVIIPGVAFDNAGNRIGYKGGYYDRFLSKYPGILSVALSFKEQLIAQIPSEAHDVKVSKIIID